MRSPFWNQLSLLLAYLSPENISPRLCLYLAVASSGLVLLIGQSSAILLNRQAQTHYAPLRQAAAQKQPEAIPPLPATQLPSAIAILNLSRAERALLHQVGDRPWDGRRWYLDKSRDLQTYLSPDSRQQRQDIAANPLRYPSKADYLTLKQSEYRHFLDSGSPMRRLILGSSIALGIPEEFLGDRDLNLGIPAASLKDTLEQVQFLEDTLEPQQIVLFGGGTPELLKQASVQEIQQDTLDLLDALRRKYPDVAITVVSVLPRSRRAELTHPHMERVDNATVSRLNRNLAQQLAQHPQIRFLDLSPYIMDKEGYLKRAFSTDGLHPNALTALVLIKLLDFSDRLDGTLS